MWCWAWHGVHRLGEQDPGSWDRPGRLTTDIAGRPAADSKKNHYRRLDRISTGIRASLTQRIQRSETPPIPDVWDSSAARASADQALAGFLSACWRGQTVEDRPFDGRQVSSACIGAALALLHWGNASIAFSLSNGLP